MLEDESAISPEVIEARGYWTAETIADLKSDPDIKANQLFAPALVLPVHDVHGKYRYSRVRPDQPPMGCKYLQPSETETILDVPPTVRDKVLDANFALIITEGEKTADSIASLGIPVVCVFGVWMGTCKVNEDTPYETHLLLPDFNHIPLHNRRVSVLFDSDIQANENIQHAAARFARCLYERGARLW